MTISKQEKDLMSLIEDYRNNECQKLLSSAHEKVEFISQKAFSKAREQVHKTIISERQRAKEHIYEAQAELKTQHRIQVKQADAMILELSRKRIEQQLLKNWHNSRTRHIWISNALHSAIKCLPKGEWQIHHKASG